MTTKEFLSRGFQIERRIQEKQRVLEGLRKDFVNVKAVSYGERVASSPTNDHIQRVVEKIMAQEKEIVGEIDQLIDAKSQIRKYIDTLDNEIYMAVLTERYINFKKWEDIADDLGYHARSVHKLHNLAMDKLGSKGH